MSVMEDANRTAAEYVLGTLDAGQRALVRERMAADSGFADLVRRWEARFAPLHELSASARPPEALLGEILAALPQPEASPAEPLEEEVKAEEPAPLPVVAEPVPEPAPETEPFFDPEAGLAAALSPVGDEEGPVAPEPVPEEPAAESAAPEPVKTEPEPAVAEAPEPAPAPTEVDVAVEKFSAAVAEVTRIETSPDEPEPASELEAPVLALPAPEAPTAPPEAPQPPPPEPEAKERGNPWRTACGLMMLALLLGGGAIAYRELHRPALAPAPAAAPPPVQEAVAPPTPPPAPQVENGPDFFAVLHSQPMPGVALTLDPDTGEVTVLELPNPAPEGMRYHLWIATEGQGARRIAVFRETGQVQSGALEAIGRAGLADARLLMTLEPEGSDPSEPTGETVFSGKAMGK